MSITIKDIARESGYAVGTVSRVLNNHPDVSDKAKEKIMAVVDKYNFRLNNNAKHLKQQANKAVAVIVKGSQNMLFASILGQLQDGIQDKGYECLINYIDETENETEQALQLIRERRPVGIMFLGSNRQFFKQQFEKITVPCIFVTNSAKELGFMNLSSVTTDDKDAAFAAIEYLYKQGHTRMGIIGGHLDDSRAAKNRYIGCEAAFREYNIDFDLSKNYYTSMFSVEAGYNATRQLIENCPDTTAIFAMSDVMAIGALRAIKDCGLSVPEDISVVGFDGIELTDYLIPKLTTIRQDRETIARRSVEILMESIDNPGKAVHEVIPFQIKKGESIKQLFLEENK